MYKGDFFDNFFILYDDKQQPNNFASLLFRINYIVLLFFLLFLNRIYNHIYNRKCNIIKRYNSIFFR